ncbi:hypothetical protein NC653_024974 [Populus alba x Populus x berolinensis]|uniref:XS domain-containing protein n=1 Tax=Populus alba x Populus x berolinensis TaxID=444605 RepID=A0AAD6MA45_9ROSI|nr:hypothetical protein NC653_024974 [Populus alba x Populus x berolinensis]
MAGGSHPKSSTHKPSSSSTPAPHRKSRWESTSNNNNNPPPPQSNQKLPKPNPSPKPNTGRSPKPATPTAGPIQPSQVPPFPFPDLGPPPPPTYGFHMLERRTIMLADGSVRSYLALPPDYQDFPRPPLPPRFLHGGPTPEFLPGGPRFPPRSPDVLGFQNQNKRKFEEELVKHGNISSSNYSNNNSIGRNYTLGGAGTSNVGDEMRAGKQMRISSGDGVGFVSSNNNRNVGEVNQSELKKAFLHFVKVINENESDRKKYLEDWKQWRLQCVACGRSSKDFPDMHALIMHTYSSDNADVRVDHLGLHKALCVLMGWNYSKPPDNSKAYQFLPADEAGANQDDLIMWPPMVIIHNTITGKGKDGRLEGLGNRAMDSKVRVHPNLSLKEKQNILRALVDLGFVGGKSKSLYGRDGHLGITLVKFGGDQSGLKEAVRLADHFEKDNRGREAWGCIQPLTFGKDDEKNPNLVKVDRSGEKNRILYGYLATVADLYKVDFETRKKVVIESHQEHKASK